MSRISNSNNNNQVQGRNNTSENQDQTTIQQFINNHWPIKNERYIDSDKNIENIRLLCINTNSFGLT